MGFGFNLFFILVLVPLSGILLLVLLITRSKYALLALGAMWAAVIGLVVLSVLTRPLFEKKVLTKADYYGSYVIDRGMFAGPDADWQYDSFRFEITPDDSIHFHVTDGNRIVRTINGRISTVKPYSSERLVIEIPEPGHHVVASNPTIYRSIWSFRLVFRSMHYHHMYFTKGDWEPIH